MRSFHSRRICVQFSHPQIPWESLKKGRLSATQYRLGELALSGLGMGVEHVATAGFALEVDQVDRGIRGDDSLGLDPAVSISRESLSQPVKRPARSSK